MAAQVSLMASAGCSVSCMSVRMNFGTWCPGRPLVSRTKGARLRCGYLSNLSFLFVLPCAQDGHWQLEKSQALEEKGDTIATSTSFTHHKRHCWGRGRFPTSSTYSGFQLEVCLQTSHSPRPSGRATLRSANCDVRRIKLNGSTQNCTRLQSGRVLGGLRLSQMLREYIRRVR